MKFEIYGAQIDGIRDMRRTNDKITGSAFESGVGPAPLGPPDTRGCTCVRLEPREATVPCSQSLRGHCSRVRCRQLLTVWLTFKALCHWRWQIWSSPLRFSVNHQRSILLAVGRHLCWRSVFRVIRNCKKDLVQRKGPYIFFDNFAFWLTIRVENRKYRNGANEIP